jgi:hypothetical protein
MPAASDCVGASPNDIQVAALPTLLAITVALQPPIASLFGLSQGQGLLVLFVLLPVVLAVVVILFVSWRTSGDPKPVLTSEILAHGLPGEGEILSVKALGGILDIRPMVRFVLRVTALPDEDPFDLEVIQSLPRGVISEFRRGDVVEVRLTPDRSRGAVVWGVQPPPG